MLSDVNNCNLLTLAIMPSVSDSGRLFSRYCLLSICSSRAEKPSTKGVGNRIRYIFDLSS